MWVKWNKKELTIQKYERETLIEKGFNCLLPQFLHAFLDGKKLSSKEAAA